MSETQLATQLNAFSLWKKRQRKTLRQLEPWLKQQGLYTAEAHRAIEQSQEALSSDNITVAAVGEFSRGKTELINALFFHDSFPAAKVANNNMCETHFAASDHGDGEAFVYLNYFVSFDFSNSGEEHGVFSTSRSLVC